MHLGTAGGASNAVERAKEIGANTFQIFSSSPRMWRSPKVDPAQAERMRTLRAKLDVGPLVIHTSYLVNVCSQTADIREKSVTAFRGEIERALMLGAEYLVLHPGSWKGMTRNEGLKLAAESIAKAIDGLPWQGTDFSILIENTAGQNARWAAILNRWPNWCRGSRRTLRLAFPRHLPYPCIGLRIVTAEGYADTITQADITFGVDAVRVWHCNDAKAARGSKLDRREHIGQGNIGVEPFRWLLHDPPVCGLCIYRRDTVDEAGDEERNVLVLQSLAM